MNFTKRQKLIKLNNLIFNSLVESPTSASLDIIDKQDPYYQGSDYEKWSKSKEYKDTLEKTERWLSSRA